MVPMILLSLITRTEVCLMLSMRTERCINRYDGFRIINKAVPVEVLPMQGRDVYEKNAMQRDEGFIEVFVRCPKLSYSGKALAVEYLSKQLRVVECGRDSK